MSASRRELAINTICEPCGKNSRTGECSADEQLRLGRSMQGACLEAAKNGSTGVIFRNPQGEPEFISWGDLKERADATSTSTVLKT